MDVKVCKNCKRLFKYIYGPEICPDCVKLMSKELNEQKEEQKPDQTVRLAVKEEEEDYKQVRDYIFTHPKASILDISEANDVTPMKLLKWIREERLEFSDDSKNAWFECEKCGAKIKSGRLCNRCKFGA